MLCLSNNFYLLLLFYLAITFITSKNILFYFSALYNKMDRTGGGTGTCDVKWYIHMSSF